MDAQTMQRYRHDLVMSGTALILFGFWDVLNGVTSMLYQSSDIKMAVDSFAGDELFIYIKITLYVLIGICLMIDLFLRLLIGLRAMNEGRQGSGNHRYVKLCIVLGLYYFANIIYVIYIYFTGHVMFINLLGLFANFISCFILSRILISVYKIRKHEKYLRTRTEE